MEEEKKKTHKTRRSQTYQPRYSVESIGLMFSQRPSQIQLDKYKLVLLGDVGVGKTSIAYRLEKYNSRFIFDEYADKRESTFGATFLTKIVDRSLKKDKIRLQVWDTAGQERFRSLAPMYYKQVLIEPTRNAHGALVVFDLTDAHTFQGAQSWQAENVDLCRIETIREEAPKDIVIALAGNKSDKNYQEVSDEAVARFCKTADLRYFKCSAKENKNIEEVFEYLVDNVKPVPLVRQKITVGGGGSGVDENRVNCYC